MHEAARYYDEHTVRCEGCASRVLGRMCPDGIAIASLVSLLCIAEALARGEVRETAAQPMNITRGGSA